MKSVVFVSVDKPRNWESWHSGPTDRVFYSDFLDNENEVTEFIERLKYDYPDSNLYKTDENHPYNYHIRFVILDYNEKDIDGFETLKTMMRAYHKYNGRI